MLHGIGRFAGEETFLAVLDFLLAFSPMFDGFRQRAARVKELLSGRGTATVLVGRPGPTAPGRLKNTAGELERRGMSPAVVLVNRFHAWPPPGCSLPAGAEADLQALQRTLTAEPALQIEDREALSRLASDALALALDYRAQAREDEAWLEEARQAVAPVPVFPVPLLRTEVRDLKGLSMVMGYLDRAA